MNFLRDVLLYLSAFVPMYFLVFVKLVVELANGNISFNVLNTTNFVTLLFLILLGCFGLFWNVKISKGTTEKVQIVSKKNITDQHFLGYFSLFVFFAIPLDLSMMSAYLVYLLVLVMIGIVYINNSLFYINPLLNLLGFNFYDVSYVVLATGEEKTGKIFFRGDRLREGDECEIIFKNRHFSFVKSQKNASKMQKT